MCTRVRLMARRTGRDRELPMSTLGEESDPCHPDRVGVAADELMTAQTLERRSKAVDCVNLTDFVLNSGIDHQLAGYPAFQFISALGNQTVTTHPATFDSPYTIPERQPSSMSASPYSSSLITASFPAEHVLLLSMSRAPVNALNTPFWLDIGRVFKQASSDPNVRCVILASSVDKAFTAGLDLR